MQWRVWIKVSLNECNSFNVYKIDIYCNKIEKWFFYNLKGLIKSFYNKLLYVVYYIGLEYYRL